MKDRTVCFTGHRIIPDGELDFIKKKLASEIEQLIGQGYCCFCAGGALGFDTLAAQAVLEAKEQFSQIKLILALPCLSQANRWCEHDKRVYEQIKQRADEVVYTSQKYTRGCMFKRNRYLVDHSSVCVCYLTKETGGTAYTVKYARSKGIVIRNLAKERPIT
jgi:uncharacterized phage-like protein YoqJ